MASFVFKLLSVAAKIATHNESSMRMNDEPKVELQDAFKYKNLYVGRPFALTFVNYSTPSCCRQWPLLILLY
jgi:hypothetical protein